MQAEMSSRFEIYTTQYTHIWGQCGERQTIYYVIFPLENMKYYLTIDIIECALPMYCRLFGGSNNFNFPVS